MPIEGVSWIGAAGFDYRELVRKIIQAESKPIALMQARVARFDVQKTAWTDIRTRLQNLRAALDELKLDATFNSRAVTSSNTNVVTATADTTAALGTYTITVNRVARAHSAWSDADPPPTSYTDQGPSGGDGNLSFTLNGVEVVVRSGVGVGGSASVTLQEIRDAINNTAGVGVTASVVDNRLVLKATKTGSANAITVTADPDRILSDLGVVETGTTTIKAANQNESNLALLDAEFVVDGLTVTRGSNTVTDVIGGVTLTLVGPGSNVTLTVQKDTQKAVDKIKAFVDQYNSVLDLIHQKLGKVTVDGQERPGDLYQNATLGRLEQTLRRHVSDDVAGLPDNNDVGYNSLSDIGIATKGTSNGGDLETSKAGKLVLDEAVLKAALEKNGPAVKELFFAADAAVKGVGEVLAEDLGLYVDAGGIIPGQIDLLTGRTDDLNDEIERMRTLLAKREQTLLDRFIAAERVLTLLQQQGSMLASQVSTWQSR